MVFTKKLREPIMRGEITCSVRIWRSPRVKVGGRYRLGEGAVEVSAKGREVLRRRLRGEVVEWEESGMSKGEWREFVDSVEDSLVDDEKCN